MATLFKLHGKSVVREQNPCDGVVYYVGVKIFDSLQEAVDHIVEEYSHNKFTEELLDEGMEKCLLPKPLAKSLKDVDDRGSISGYIVRGDNEKFRLISYDEYGRVNFISQEVAGISFNGMKYGRVISNIGQIGITEQEYDERFEAKNKDS